VSLIRGADLVASPWKNGGGVTREVAAFPEGAALDAFVWRVSVADVAQAGPFSRFAGIDRTLAVDVMAGSAIGSPMLKARAPLIIDPADDTWFSMRLMRKDIGLALATARDEGVALPSAAVADDVLRRADDLGYGDRDIAVLGEALARADLRPAA